MPEIGDDGEQGFYPFPLYRQFRLFEFQFLLFLQPFVRLQPQHVTQCQRRERRKIAATPAEVYQSPVFTSAVCEFFSASSASAFCAFWNFAVATQTA